MTDSPPVITATSMQVPIGSIVAFAGSLDDIPTDWLLCDGRGLDVSLFAELFQAIGTNWGGNGNPLFYLPDLRGAFLRGVDHDRSATPTEPPRDPERDDRWGFAPPAAPDNPGNKRNAVGSFQHDATALPNEGFETTNAGRHSHQHVVKGLEASKGSGGGDTINGHGHPHKTGWPLKAAGNHTHEVEGGDAETRPYNAYVYWLIRAR